MLFEGINRIYSDYGCLTIPGLVGLAIMVWTLMA